MYRKYTLQLIYFRTRQLKFTKKHTRIKHALMSRPANVFVFSSALKEVDDQ